MKTYRYIGMDDALKVGHKLTVIGNGGRGISFRGSIKHFLKIGSTAELLSTKRPGDDYVYVLGVSVASGKIISQSVSISDVMHCDDIDVNI